jgi:hypothetical protein
MHFADLYVKEPLEKVAEDWDFLSERLIKKFTGGFIPVGDNIFGVRPVSHEAANSVGSTRGPLDLVKTRRNFEIGPKGKLQVAREPFTIAVTVNGTPHHTEHLFGYWHINDKDEIILPLPPPSPSEPGYLFVIMGVPKGNETDRVAWYCDQCTTLVFLRELCTGRINFDKFWSWERAAVREYNSDPANRTCPQCGHVNPPGYCAFHTWDTPEEREARMNW